MGQSRTDPQAQSPKRELAARSRRPQSAPRICGSISPWRYPSAESGKTSRSTKHCQLCRMAITTARTKIRTDGAFLEKGGQNRRDERTGGDGCRIGERLVIGHFHQHGQPDPQEIEAVKAEDQQKAQARHEQKNAGEPKRGV